MAKSVHGVFKVVKGKVLVLDTRGNERKAKLGMKVYPKETIQTNKTSRAKIVMIDKNEINVTSNTKMIIADYKYSPKKDKKSVLLNVMYGKIRAKVKQKYDDQANKFQVKTKSAVAGVRGTDFFTSYNRRTNRTNVVTFEGRVDFGIPGRNGQIQNSVSVQAGQSSSLMAGQTPTKPIEVPRTELTRMNASTEAEPAPKESGKPGENRRNPSSEEGQGDNKPRDPDEAKNNREPASFDEANSEPKNGPDEGRDPANYPEMGGPMDFEVVDNSDLPSVDGPGGFHEGGFCCEPPPPPPDMGCPTGNCNVAPPNICDINPQFCAGASSLILNVNHNP